MKKFSLISHRGRIYKNAGKLHYENNIAGIRDVLEIAPDYLEVDTRNLEDGVVILAHDPFDRHKKNTKWEDLSSDKLESIIGENYKDILFEHFIKDIIIPDKTINLMIDVKDYSQIDEIKYYYDLITSNSLMERVTIISWNLQFIEDFYHFQKNKSDKVKLGLSFIPISVPRSMFKLFESLINRLIPDACGRVFLCDLNTLNNDKRLHQPGLFPWFTTPIEDLLKRYGADISYGFDKLFISKLFLSLSFPFGNLKHQLRNNFNEIFIWDFNNKRRLSNIKRGKFEFINAKHIIIFSSILDRINTTEILQRLNDYEN